MAAAGPFPLLLTAPDALDPRVSAHLSDQQIDHVVLVGGAAAVAPAVQDSLENAGATVTRLAGRNRIDTAELAAELFGQRSANHPACADGPMRIGLAPAQHPERALVAEPLLARRCTPLRFSGPDGLPLDVRNTLYLAGHGAGKALVQVFGDQTAIADAALDVSVPPIRLAVVERQRIGDTDRFESVVLVVDESGERSRYSFVPGRDVSVPGSGFSPGQFAWSPDGTRLAVAGTRRLFVLDVESGGFQEATIGDHAFRYLPDWHWPEWSPDSARLAFTAFVDDPATCRDANCGQGFNSSHAAEMFLFDTVTGTTTRLTHNDVNDAIRSWSPDSTRVAVTRSRVDMGIFGAYWYPESLHVMDITTGVVTDIYEHAQSTGEVWWAPDGSHLAFTGTVKDSRFYHDHRAFLAASDGSSVRQLTPRIAPQIMGVGWVVGWSPDSKFVLHSNLLSRMGRSTETQYIHDVASGVDTSIDISIDGSSWARGWNRDGTKLLYWQYQPSPSDRELLALVGVDRLSGNIERAVDIPAEITDSKAIAVTPDASQVAFIYGDLQLQFALVGRRWAGLRARTEVPFDPFVDEFPLCDLAWTANGIRGNCAGYYDF